MGAYEYDFPFVITQQPVSGSFYVGDSLTLAVVARGGVPPLSYRWRLNGSDISGATSTDLALGPLALVDAGPYDCAVTDSGISNVTSDPAALAVADHLQIGTQPRRMELHEGAPYTLFVETAGGYLPLAYQWSKDGTDILDATASSYEIASFAESNAGTYTLHIHDSLTDAADSIPAELFLAISGMPIAGVAGLAAAALAAGLLGALRLRRRTK